MAPDFAPRNPDDDHYPDEGSGYSDFNPAGASHFDDFLEAIEVVDLIRLPAFNKLEALLSDKVVAAVADLFHDFDEGLYQGRGSEHPALAAIDECFTSTEPGDVREVFMAVRAIIDRAIDERVGADGESDTDSAATEIIYDQLLRSGCEVLVTTMFNSIFQAYQERLHNVFIEPFCEGIQLQRQRLSLLGLDADFDGAGRNSHARALYEEKVQLAERISQEILAEEYTEMDKAYPELVELAVSELFDIAPDLMQTPPDESTPDVDYLATLEAEWRDRYATTFGERLDTTVATAREQLRLAVSELHDALPPSAKKLP